MVKSDVPLEELESIAEAAFQSDLYTVGLTNAFLSALAGDQTYSVTDF
jgi:hypothetical protein